MHAFCEIVDVIIRYKFQTRQNSSEMLITYHHVLVIIKYGIYTRSP